MWRQRVRERGDRHHPMDPRCKNKINRALTAREGKKRRRWATPRTQRHRDTQEQEILHLVVLDPLLLAPSFPSCLPPCLSTSPSPSHSPSLPIFLLLPLLLLHQLPSTSYVPLQQWMNRNRAPESPGIDHLCSRIHWSSDNNAFLSLYI